MQALFNRVGLIAALQFLDFTVQTCLFLLFFCHLPPVSYACEKRHFMPG
jgi:hypothetical protein